MAPPVPSRTQRYATVVIRAVVVAALAFAATEFVGRFIASQILPPRYVATAEIAVAEPGGDMGATGTDDTSYPDSVKTILLSPSLLLPIIEDLQLNQAWAPEPDDPDKTPTPLTTTEALDRLDHALKVTRVGKSDTFEISVGVASPERAARIANAIADRYKTMRDTEQSQRFQRDFDTLAAQIAEAQEIVAGKKAALEKLSAPAGAPPPSAAALQDAQHEVDKNEALLNALTVRRDQVKADAAVAQSPVNVLLRAQVPQRPNHHFAHLVTHFFAVIAAITAMCFVEAIALFLRAGERDG